MSEDRILDKIRNLLALAENAGTPEESENARAKAEAMMLRHSIDAAMLADSGRAQSEEIVQRTITISAPYTKEKTTLFGVVTHNLMCQALYDTEWRYNAKTRRHTRTWTKGATATIVGFESDVDRAEMLFTSLLLQASRDVMRATPANPREDVATYRSSWMLGFAAAVHNRLAEIHRRTRSEVDADNRGGRGTELVLADRRSLVDARYREWFPDTVTGKPVTSSGSGKGHGYRAGQKADLGQTRVGGDRRRIGD